MSIKVIDTASSASLFVTLLGALLVRHQFVLGFRPRISYKSAYSLKQSTSNSLEHFETWQVKISNAGVGAAIITRTEFAIELGSIKQDFASIGIQSVVHELEKVGLVRYRDYGSRILQAGLHCHQKKSVLHSNKNGNPEQAKTIRT